MLLRREGCLLASALRQVGMEAMGTSRSGKLIANSRLDLFPSALGCVSAAWLSGHRKRGLG